LIWTLKQIVAHARRASPYFAAQLAQLPASGWRLHELPLTDPGSYWCAEQELDRWPVLTAPLGDALVFKTGGSCGSGKFSVYTRAEWRAFVTAFARGMASQLSPGDRVANLFYAGDLYASFLFIHGALQHSPLAVSEYPFSGAVESALLAQAIERHGITVLAGVPAQLLQFALWLDRHARCLDGVRTILYGGESLFTDQLPLLARVFPGARCASIGYASVDAGLLGASTPDCRLGEHRVFQRETRVEILDEETRAPISAPGISGQLVVTSLTRQLMPLIRYPVGDRAAWVEPAGATRRKFVLCGRSSVGQRVRVGASSLFPDQIERVIQRVLGPCAWQLQIRRSEAQDRVSVLLARPLSPGDAGGLRLALAAQFDAGPEGGLPFDVRACAIDHLQRHARSGKLLRVVDLRSYEGAS